MAEKKTRTRMERQQRYLAVQGAFLGTSSYLAESGIVLLQLALSERGSDSVSSSDNHFARHALGSILLAVAAFEAWLNEATFRLYMPKFDPAIKKLAFHPIMEKYYGIPAYLRTSMPLQSDLEIALSLRNEIEHYLPLDLTRGTTNPPPDLPNWLKDLQSRGLVMTTGDPYVDYPANEQLACYKLAYWVWETISSAAKVFDETIMKTSGPFLMNSLGSGLFEGYKRVQSPDKLDPVRPKNQTQRSGRAAGSK